MTAINNVLATNNSFSTFALRLPLGIIFAAHGAQKLCRASVDRLLAKC